MSIVSIVSFACVISVAFAGAAATLAAWQSGLPRVAPESVGLHASKLAEATSLLKQFVANLETTVLAGSTPDGGGAEEPAVEPTAEPPPATGNGAATVPSTTTSTTAPARKVEHGPVDPIDLIEHAAAPLLKRLLPVVLGLVILVLVLRRWRRD